MGNSVFTVAVLSHTSCPDNGTESVKKSSVQNMSSGQAGQARWCSENVKGPLYWMELLFMYGY